MTVAFGLPRGLAPVTLVDPGPQLWVGRRRPRPDRLMPVRNDARWQHLYKPVGGLWTSPPAVDAGGRIAGSDWTVWYAQHRESLVGRGRSERPLQRGWVLTPAPDARVVDAGDSRQLGALFMRYPVWAGSPNRRECVGLDFEALTREYDGLHLSADAVRWQSRFNDAPSLWAWDVASTLWFRWAFAGVPAPVTWPAPTAKALLALPEAP